MKILFVHQNFPGQFPHLSTELARRGHEVLALTDEKNQRSSAVRTLRYKAPDGVKTDSPLGRVYSEHAERGLMAGRGARALSAAGVARTAGRLACNPGPASA